MLYVCVIDGAAMQIQHVSASETNALSDVLKWKRCSREGFVVRTKARLQLFKCGEAER